MAATVCCIIASQVPLVVLKRMNNKDFSRYKADGTPLAYRHLQRLSLSAAQQAQLPENPVGLIELTDTQLSAVAGGVTKSSELLS